MHAQRAHGLLVLLLAGAVSACSNSAPAGLEVTLAGAESVSLHLDQIYCSDIAATTGRTYMVRLSQAGKAYPGLQANLRSAAQAVGSFTPPKDDTDITLNLSGTNVYVTGTSFHLTITAYTATKVLSGKMEVTDGKLSDLATHAKALSLSPTSISFTCPCVDDLDTPTTSECSPQPYAP
jgi:hypothetical protein